MSRSQADLRTGVGEGCENPEIIRAIPIGQSITSHAIHNSQLRYRRPNPRARGQRTGFARTRISLSATSDRSRSHLEANEQWGHGGSTGQGSAVGRHIGRHDRGRDRRQSTHPAIGRPFSRGNVADPRIYLRGFADNSTATGRLTRSIVGVPGWRNGRRGGLKPPFSYKGVWVRVPSRALLSFSIHHSSICLVGLTHG